MKHKVWWCDYLQDQRVTAEYIDKVHLMGRQTSFMYRSRNLKRAPTLRLGMCHGLHSTCGLRQQVVQAKWQCEVHLLHCRLQLKLPWIFAHKVVLNQPETSLSNDLSCLELYMMYISIIQHIEFSRQSTVSPLFRIDHTPRDLCVKTQQR